MRAAAAALVAIVALGGAPSAAAAQESETPADLPTLAYGRSCDDTPCGVSVQDRDGAVRELTSGADRPVDWFPDGERLLVARTIGERVDLYEVDATHGTEARLVEEAGTVAADGSGGDPAASAALSPLGDRVAFVRAGALVVKDLSTAVETALDVPVIPSTKPVWSPDGARLALPATFDLVIEGRGQPGALVVDAATGAARQYLAAAADPDGSCDGPGSASAVAWSPGGNALAVGAFGLGSPCAAYSSIVSLDGSRPIPLATGAPVPASWSPDGSLVALVASFRTTGVTAGYVYGAAGTSVRELGELTFSPGVAGWAADSSRVVVVRPCVGEFLCPVDPSDRTALVVAVDPVTGDELALGELADLGPSGANGLVVAPGAVARAAGLSRVDTAVAVSRQTWETSTAVVVAPSASYAEALVAAPLAGAEDAPVLLTGADGLAPQVAAEIARLGATQAFVVGGESVLSTRVEADLAAAGVRTVARLGGDSAFATSAAVARVVGGAEAFVVEGANADPSRGWPDAVSVSGLAAVTRRPVLLVERDALPDETAEVARELGIETVTVIGGDAAVSEEVATQFEQLGAVVSRAAGETRYGTSVAVAARSEAEGLSPRTTWVASGTDFPDSLAAGPAAAHEGAVLVLSDRDQLGASEETSALLTADRVDRIRLAGGTRVLTSALEVELERRLPWP